MLDFFLLFVLYYLPVSERKNNEINKMKNETRIERMYGLENHAPVMKDKTIFKLTWKDEDSGRVNSKEFVNEIGKDHSGSMDALEHGASD